MSAQSKKESKQVHQKVDRQRVMTMEEDPIGIAKAFNEKSETET